MICARKKFKFGTNQYKSARSVIQAAPNVLVQLILAQNAKLDLYSTLIRHARRLVARRTRLLLTVFVSCVKSLATNALDQ